MGSYGGLFRLFLIVLGWGKEPTQGDPNSHLYWKTRNKKTVERTTAIGIYLAELILSVEHSLQFFSLYLDWESNSF